MNVSVLSDLLIMNAICHVCHKVLFSFMKNNRLVVCFLKLFFIYLFINLNYASVKNVSANNLISS